MFDQLVKNGLRTYDNIKKTTTSCLLDYLYFKDYYKVIAINFSKQQALDADPKAIQQIKFTGHLDRAEGVTMFFIIEKAKETVLGFSQGTVKVL